MVFCYWDKARVIAGEISISFIEPIISGSSIDYETVNFPISLSRDAFTSHPSNLVAGLKPAPHVGDPLVKPVTFTSTLKSDSPFPSVTETQPFFSMY